jgi:hypothetical protein
MRTFIRDSHQKQLRSLDISWGSLYSVNAVGNTSGLSTNVVSALSAFIACITIGLIIMTAYMSWRVYIKNKKQVPAKGEAVAQ